MTEIQLKYLERKGKLVETGLTDDEVAERAFRASHLCICDVCGKEYIDHPYVSECRDDANMPFLHLICNGDIVKL